MVNQIIKKEKNSTNIPSGQIVNVQGLRALAVLLVAFLHLYDLEHVYSPNPLLPAWAILGHAGVDIFFVISGFIMVFIGHYQPANPKASGRFLYLRWARIYPNYWLWFLITLIIYLYKPHWLRLEQGQLERLTESFFLIPTWTPQLIPVSWTLKYEIYFYFIFAIIILFPAARRHIILLIWAMAMLIGQQFCYRAPDILCNKTFFLIMHPLVFEFILGSIIAWLYLNQTRRHAFQLFLASIFIFFLSLYLYIRSGIALDDNAWNRVVIFGIPASLLLYGALEVERQHGLVAPTWLIIIGNASYSIYLSHLVLFELLFRGLSSLSIIPGPVLSPAVFITGIGLGTLSYRFFERPLLLGTRNLIETFNQHRD